MDELVTDFKTESLELIGQLIVLLESVEGDPSQYRQLEKYGQIIDRIMGAATSLALVLPEKKDVLEAIGKYSALCKEIAYKASQVEDNEALFDSVVGLLFDAAETVEKMLSQIDSADSSIAVSGLSQTFLDRLTWITKQFSTSLRGTVAHDSNPNSEMKDLLKKFGL